MVSHLLDWYFLKSKPKNALIAENGLKKTNIWKLGEICTSYHLIPNTYLWYK